MVISEEPASIQNCKTTKNASWMNVTPLSRRFFFGFSDDCDAGLHSLRKKETKKEGRHASLQQSILAVLVLPMFCAKQESLVCFHIC